MRTSCALLLLLVVSVSASRSLAQDRQPEKKPVPAVSPSQEILRLWKEVHRKLIAMAEDFPEDKFDFRGQKDERTFVENLLHVAAEDGRMMSAIKGAPVGWQKQEAPTRDDFKTRDQIVGFLRQTEDAGEKLIVEQGDEGLNREIKYPYGNRMVHASFGWSDIIEHAGEHYGQLVVYYRVNQLVPPESRPQEQPPRP